MRLIGLDWGTSSLRAYRFDDAGAIVDQRASADGIQRLGTEHAADGRTSDQRFRNAFETLCAPWLDEPGAAAVPVIAAGMIGSRHGWQETPYLTLPVGLDQLVAGLTRIDARAGRPFAIVAGIAPPADRPADVARGEETQAFGALEGGPDREDCRIAAIGGSITARGAAPGDCELLLPGTHSKWLAVHDGRLQSFRTFLTGELYDVLARHSIVGRLFAPDAHFDRPAFELGLARVSAEPAALTALIFSTRAEVLLDRMTGAAAPSYLSGLLIGAELSAMGPPKQGPLRIVANEVLTHRYGLALDWLGWRWSAAREHAAAHGLFAIAARAGLLGHAA